jgi:hypothetical protein
MNSFLMPQFRVLYGALPEHLRQQQARQAYALFQQYAKGTFECH